MSGVLWAGSAWCLAMLMWAWRDGNRGADRNWLNRENIALLLAWLGTVSIAAQTDTEQLLRDPVVLERVVRGGLAASSLLLSLPVLVPRLIRPPRRGYIGLSALTGYLVVATITTLYSVAPLVTAAKAFELGAGLAAVAAAALAPDGRDRLKLMIRFVMVMGTSLLATAVAGFFLFPSEFAFVSPFRPGFVAALTMRAPFASANELSALGALVALYSLAQLVDREEHRWRSAWLASLVLGLASVLLSSGRQGVIMFLGAAAVLLWYRRRSLLLALVAPATAMLVWLNWDTVFRSFARGQPQLLSNLTGRLPWWQAAIEAWSVHPWTGYGYGAGGRFVGLASIGRSQVSNIHSGYLEALIGVGLLGVVPLLAAIGVVAAWALRSLRSDRNTAEAILLIPLTLHAFVDLGFGGWLKADFLLLACLAGLADWSRSRYQTTHQPHRISAAVS